MSLSQIRREALDQVKKNRKSFSKLVLIHTAITAGISILLMLTSWLTQYIGSTGGIDSVDTQIALTTAQITLQLLSIIAIPFWNAGLIFCALRSLREKINSPVKLTEGFLCWSPMISAILIQGLVYFSLSILASLGCSAIISSLPLPSQLYDALQSYTENPIFPPPENIQFFLKIYVAVYFITFLILLIPKLYLHRLVSYRIMDDEEEFCTGLQAVLYSRILMKGNRRKLFLLDLSFWWFFLLDLGISIISLGNLFLTDLGMTLPLDPEIAAWCLPMAALLLRLVLYYFAKPKLAFSYAIFYLKVMEQIHTPPDPPQPPKMPWKY